MGWFYMKLKIKTLRDHYITYPLFLAIYIPYILLVAIIYGGFFFLYFIPISIRYFGIVEGVKLIPYLLKSVLKDAYNRFTRKKRRGADSDG